MNAFIVRVCLLAALALNSVVASAQIGGPFLGTRWADPDNNVITAVKIANDGYGPGASSWSVVGPNIGFDPRPFRPDTAHAANAVTLTFDQLLPAANLRRPADIFKSALDKWQAASLNQWVNLGQIPDGGLQIGALGAGIAAMRVAVIKDEVVFDGGGGNPNFDDLAHAFRPDTLMLGWHLQGWGTIGGDIHFRPSIVQDPVNGIRFVDSLTPGANEYDLETVMLHEIGHALGLDHNAADPTSIMRPKYTGVQRVLSNSDTLNIRLLYMVPLSVPEPANGAMLACGVLVLVLALGRRWRVKPDESPSTAGTARWQRSPAPATTKVSSTWLNDGQHDR